MARERGEFDDLPGAGKPIPGIDNPRDELWWVKQLLRRENLSVTPPTIAIRMERDEVIARIARMTSEADVRGAVEALNAKIRKINSTAASGPPSTVMPLDPEDVVEAWRRSARPATS